MKTNPNPSDKPGAQTGFAPTTGSEIDPGHKHWTGHEWRMMSIYTDECIHCGTRATEGFGTKAREHCPARFEKAVRCSKCEHWREEDEHCEVFDKRTWPSHGGKCTAYTPNVELRDGGSTTENKD